jgi:hypothetical protein
MLLYPIRFDVSLNPTDYVDLDNAMRLRIQDTTLIISLQDGKDTLLNHANVGLAYATLNAILVELASSIDAAGWYDMKLVSTQPVDVLNLYTVARYQIKNNSLIISLTNQVEITYNFADQPTLAAFVSDFAAALAALPPQAAGGLQLSDIGVTVQGYDSGLDSLSGLTGAGVVTATATNVFAMRAIGVSSSTDILDRASADSRYALAASSGVTSFNTRTGIVTLTSGDVTTALTFTPLNAATYTAADVLSKLLTVDGTGSLLDADLLDGQNGSYYQDAGNLNAGTILSARLTGTYAISVSGSAATLTTPRTIGGVSFDGSANINLPGVNTTGSQNTTGSAATLTTGRTLAITGDLTWTSPSFNGSGNVTAAGTLATVNSNVGSFGSTSAVPIITVNAKGLITAVSTAALGTAAVANIGTSGATVPLLNTSNTFSGATTTFTGNVTMAKASPTWVFDDTAQIAPSPVGLFRLYSAAGNLYYTRNLSTTRDFSSEASVLVINGTTGAIIFTSSVLTAAGNQIWHGGNDGASSGLDSDLLDGQQGSFYQDAANLNAGTILAARMPAHTGDVTSSAGSVALTLATVNSNVGSFGSATAAPTFTVNAKGLLTAAGSVAITPAWSSITSKPTTISGFGITDAVLKTGDTMTGNLLLTGGGTYAEPATIAGVLSMDTVGGDFTISSRSNGGSTGIAFRTSSSGTGAVRMRISSAGDVGIGASAPSQKFAVDVGREQVFGVDTLGYVTMPHADASGYSVLKAASGRGLRFMSNTTTLFTLPSSPASTVSLGYAALQIGDSSSSGYSIYLGSIGNSDLNLRGGDGNVARTADVIISVKDNVEVARFTDTARLGIGTNAPNATLGVVGRALIGNVDVGGVLGVYNASSGTVAAFQSNGAANGDTILAVNQGGTTVTGSVYGFKAGMSCTSDALATVQQGGAGNAVFESLVLGVGDALSRYSINGGAAWSVGLDNSDGDKFKIAGSGSLGTTDRLTIDSSGNVGIGTTSPLAKLHVDAHGSLTGGEPTYRGNLIIYQGNNIEAGHGGLEFKVDNSSSGYGSRILNVFDGSASYDVRFQTRSNSSAWTTRMSIGGSAGRVGVGTTSPLTLFHAAGTATFGAGNQGSLIGSSAVNIHSSSGSVASLTIWQNGVASSQFGHKANDTNLYITNDYAGAGLGYAVTSIALTSGGDVGVGTTTPAHKLDVAGTFRHTGVITNAAGIKTYSVAPANQGNVNSTYEIMRISRDPLNWSNNMPYEITVYSKYYQSGGMTKWLLSYGYESNGTLSCIDARGAQKFRVYLGAEVTVNANVAYRPVFVDIPNYYDVAIEVKFSTNVVTSITDESQVHFTGTMAVGTGTLYSGDTHIVPDGGNVGIGTTSPGTILAVRDPGTGLGFTNAAGGNLNIGLLAGTGSSLGYIFQRANADLIFGTNNTETLRILANGNVGIGTSSPDAKLHVVGSIAVIDSISNPAIYIGEAFTGGNYGYLTWDRASDLLQLGTQTFGPTVTINESGNVGIGESSPSERLVVAGQGTGRMLVGDVGFGDGYTGLSMNGVLSSTNYNLLGSPGQNHLWINRATGGNIYFREGNTDQVTIQATTGNVGIGNTNPAAGKLQVSYTNPVGVPAAGIAGHAIAAGTSGYGAAIGVLTSGNVYLQATRWDGLATNYDLLLQPNGGNVGIGMTDPAYQFEVGKTTGGTLAVSTTGQAGLNVSPLIPTINFLGYLDKVKAAITAEDREGNVLGGWLNFHTMDTSNVSQKRVTIDPSGNFGIGIAVPLSRLHTYRNGSAATASLTIEEAGTGDASLSFLLTGAIQWSMGLDNSDSDKFKISASSALGTTDYLSIDGAGATAFTSSTLTAGGNTVWHAGNDGAGTGLDADTVDGIQAAVLVRTNVDAQNIGVASLYLNGGRGLSMGYSGGNYGGIGYNITYTGTSDTHIAPSTDTASRLDFTSGGMTLWGNAAGLAGRTVTWTTLLQVPLSGNMLLRGDAVWTAGNDGASSGLDADLLDGQQGSFYQNAGNLNAGTLLAARMPALAGDITTSAGAVATTLATVNSNVGSFGSATQVATFTVNAKGLITAASNTTIAIPWSAIASGKPTTISGYGITDAVARASFAVSPNSSVAAVDIRNITNPTTGIAYVAGGRFRFSSLNDDSTTPYADVIDLSTYTDSSGGGFNSLYFGKNSQVILHKYAAAGGTSWTTKTVAYTDSVITGSVATLTTGRTLTITGDLTWTSPSFNGSGNVTAAGTLATVNSNVGSFGSATAAPTFTVNGKGLITAAGTVTITPAWSSVTSKPTTLSGFGITNAVSQQDGSRTNLDFNAQLTSGFYNTDASPTNGPSAHAYGQLIVAKGIDTGLQIAGGYNNALYFRGWHSSGTFYAWQKIWTDSNDGASSGLDADLLDGYQSSSAATGNTIALRDSSGNLFARDFTASRGDGTGVIYLNAAGTRYLYYDGTAYNMPNAALNVGGSLGVGAITSSGSITASGAGGFISATYQAGARNPIWRFGDATGYGLSYFQGSAGTGGSDSIGFHFGTATSAGSIVNITPTGIVINGNAAWHAGNDGASSGLDADLLDGQHGSFYQSASNINAGTLGLSYVPSQLVRSGSTGGTNWNDASSVLNGFSGLLLGTATNGPGGGVYYHPWTIEYSTSGNVTQFAIPYSDASAIPTGLRYRGRYDGSWTSWNTIWSSGNDGASSGLDADLLDGLEATQFARLGTTSTFTTQQIISGQTVANDWTNYGLQIREVGLVGAAQSSGSYNPALTFHWAGRFARRLQMNASGILLWDSDTVWHAGNDGSGSGLDADLLDGLNSSATSVASTIAARDASAQLTAHSFHVAAAAGLGIRFWESSDYSIYMSDSGNGTWGGRVISETTSDYNMYFKMTSGTNRGFVFENGATSVAGIDGAGNIRSAAALRSVNGLVSIGSTSGSTHATRHVNPGGGSRTTATATETGAIKIRLPNLHSNAMFRMRVEIYNYSAGQSETFVISGYPYSATWANCSAEQYTDSNATKKSVRFGNDGTYNCVWIGELTQTWSHPQVFITEFNYGYSGYTLDYSSGWDISFVASFDTVQITRAAAYHWNATNDGAGSGLNADLLDGYDSSQNSDTANAVAVRDGSGYLNQRVIRNAVGGTTDGMYVGYGNASSGVTRLYGGGSTNASMRINAANATWYDGTSEQNLWYKGNLPLDSWQTSTDGVARLYFEASSHTYLRSNSNIYFMNAGGSIIATFNPSGNFTAAGTIVATSTITGTEFYSGSGNYFRAGGTGGFYCQTYDGGWNMTDGTWIRSIANKGIITGGAIQGATVTATSDRRLKTEIEPLTGFNEVIDSTNVYSFIKDGIRQWGVIAQEVLETPAALLVHEGGTVHEEDGDAILTVDFAGFTYALLAEVKELRKRVAVLENSSRA